MTEPLPFGLEAEIVLLLSSPEHRYEGRPKDGPLPRTSREVQESIEIRAELGIVGDRFFNQPAHRLAAVTVMAAESVDTIAADLGLSSVPQLADTRRNILLRGVDVDALRGATFSLDSGDGPVTFLANRPANPCAWMDEMLAPGAFKALRKHGGMRCTPLSSGILRLGPAVFRSSVLAARV